jgi:hypothetical protein
MVAYFPQVREADKNLQASINDALDFPGIQISLVQLPLFLG